MQYYYKIFFILFLVTISCDKIHKSDSSKKNKIPQKVTGDSSDIQYSDMHTKYHDTVFKDAYGFGDVDYDKTIKGIDSANILERYIILYTSIDKNSKTFEEIEKTKQDAFLDTSKTKNGKFYFEYKFDKVGDNMLKLAFEDLTVYLSDSIKGDTLTLVKYPVTELPVFVIDSSTFSGYDKNGRPYYIFEKTIYVKRKDTTQLAKEQQRKIDSMKRILNNQ